MCRCSSSRGFRRPSSGASGSASASSEAATSFSGMAVRWSQATRGTLPSLLLLLMVSLIGPTMMYALPPTDLSFFFFFCKIDLGCQHRWVKRGELGGGEGAMRVRVRRSGGDGEGTVKVDVGRPETVGDLLNAVLAQTATTTTTTTSSSEKPWLSLNGRDKLEEAESVKTAGVRAGDLLYLMGAMEEAMEGEDMASERNEGALDLGEVLGRFGLERTASTPTASTSKHLGDKVETFVLRRSGGEPGAEITVVSTALGERWVVLHAAALGAPGRAYSAALPRPPIGSADEIR